MTGPDPLLDRRALGQRAQPDPDLVARFAARTFSATSADGSLSATVTGAGEITAVQVASGALRASGAERFGAAVVAAVNAALDAQETARAETFGLPGGRPREQADAFLRRMDELAGRLGALHGRVSEQLAAVRDLRGTF